MLGVALLKVTLSYVVRLAWDFSVGQLSSKVLKSSRLVCMLTHFILTCTGMCSLTYNKPLYSLIIIIPKTNCLFALLNDLEYHFKTCPL